VRPAVPHPSAPSKHAAPIPPPQAVAWTVLALLAARLIGAALVPLTPDEAYYFLWSRFPAWSYYDHPGMVAWWMAAGTWLAGESPFAIRLVSVLSLIPTSLAVYATGAVLFDRPAALRAVLYANLTFLLAIGGILATPDAPSVLFWSLAVLALALVLRTGDGRWWLAVGLAAGLGVTSKLTGLFLGPGILLLLLRRDQRRWLATPWPWLGGAVALLVVAPMLLWNAGHDWVTFAKQFGRLDSGGFAPLHLPEFIATQFVLLNPLIAVLAGYAALRAWRERRTPRGRAIGALLLVAAPLVAYMTFHSLHGQIQGQWLAPLYPMLALAAAGAVENAPYRLRRFAFTAVPVGVIVLALGLVGAVNPRGLIGPRADLASIARGWEDVATRAEVLRVEAGAKWIALTRYWPHAEVAYHLRDVGTPVVAIDEVARYAFAPPPDVAALAFPALVLTTEAPQTLAPCFATVTPVGSIDRKSGDRVVETLNAYLAEGLAPGLLAKGCDGLVGRR
jgi:4-amino-4-deoxy-L-arabinose transferase-like glycosyltransferase